MRNSRGLIIAVILSVFLIVNAYAADANPLVLLKSVANSMIAGLKENKASLKNKPEVVYGLAQKYVVPHADIEIMSKHVLSPQIWRQASATERDQFQKEFTKTLIRTYASALSAYDDQTVHFYPPRGDYAAAKTVEISSEIISVEHQPINVSYRLMRSGNTWKLYDLSVEGVSMLESFRSQFADILSQGNMAQLISRMSEHNKGMRG